jgi:hypothetical protein
VEQLLDRLLDRLLARAYLFDDPGAYEAGVRDALEQVAADREPVVADQVLVGADQVLVVDAHGV